MTPRSEQLLARLHERMMRLGGPEVAGADYEDVRRALPEIEVQAFLDGVAAGARGLSATRSIRDDSAAHAALYPDCELPLPHGHTLDVAPIP